MSITRICPYHICCETCEITYQSQLCVNKYVYQALYQMLQTTKMKYGKMLSLPRLTICILHHNPPSWIVLAQSNTPTSKLYLRIKKLFVSHSAQLSPKRVALRGKRSITEGRWVDKYTYQPLDVLWCQQKAKIYRLHAPRTYRSWQI